MTAHHSKLQLTTVRDYINAPSGTVVVRGYIESACKLINGNWVRGTAIVTSESMARNTARVARWGWSDDS